MNTYHAGELRDMNGAFNVIDCAFRYLTDEQKEQMVKQALREIVRQAMIKEVARCDEPQLVFSAVAEKLQRKMDAVNCSKFHKELLENTGIDAREPKFTSGKYAVNTMEDWSKLASFLSANHIGQRQKYKH